MYRPWGTNPQLCDSTAKLDLNLAEAIALCSGIIDATQLNSVGNLTANRKLSQSPDDYSRPGRSDQRNQSPTVLPGHCSRNAPRRRRKLGMERTEWECRLVESEGELQSRRQPREGFRRRHWSDKELPSRRVGVLILCVSKPSPRNTPWTFH